MPIPPLTIGEKIANYLLYAALYQSLVNQPITLPTVKTWKLVISTSPNPLCNYTEIADNPMQLSSANLAATYPENSNFRVVAIAAYCRDDYQSIDFPNNPRYYF